MTEMIEIRQDLKKMHDNADLGKLPIKGKHLVTGIGLQLFYNKRLIMDDKKYGKYWFTVSCVRNNEPYQLIRIPAVVMAKTLYPLLPMWLYNPEMEYHLLLSCSHAFKARYSVALLLITESYEKATQQQPLRR